MSRGTRGRDIESFAQNGFCVIDHVFTDSECAQLLDELESESQSDKRGGIRNLMSLSIVDSFANDERLLALTCHISCRRLVPFKAILFTKTEYANWLVAWHQDTALPVEREVDDPEWGPYSKKAGILFSHAPTWALSKVLALRIHLDPSNEENGPLRVIPGTHFRRMSDEELSEAAMTSAAVTCTTGRGGVIAMSPLIVHASSKSVSDEPRRVLHIEYAESLNFAPDVRLAVA